MRAAAAGWSFVMGIATKGTPFASDSLMVLSPPGGDADTRALQNLKLRSILHNNPIPHGAFETRRI
jgi:hypothetical protein